jgi:hypothetical protein
VAVLPTQRAKAVDSNSNVRIALAADAVATLASPTTSRAEQDLTARLAGEFIADISGLTVLRRR